MPKKFLSVAEAKATLSERIREVTSGEPISITRHGKEVGALVHCRDVQALERLRAAGPDGGLASIAGGWEDSEELVSIIARSSRVEERGGADLD